MVKAPSLQSESTQFKPTRLTARWRPRREPAHSGSLRCRPRGASNTQTGHIRALWREGRRLFQRP